MWNPNASTFNLFKFQTTNRISRYAKNSFRTFRYSYTEHFNVKFTGNIYKFTSMSTACKLNEYLAWPNEASSNHRQPYLLSHRNLSTFLPIYFLRDRRPPEKKMEWTNTRVREEKSDTSYVLREFHRLPPNRSIFLPVLFRQLRSKSILRTPPPRPTALFPSKLLFNAILSVSPRNQMDASTAEHRHRKFDARTRNRRFRLSLYLNVSAKPNSVRK